MNTHRIFRPPVATITERRLASLAIAVIALTVMVFQTPVKAVENQPSLAPIQLSPERRQLIGLKLARVEERALSGHIATTGLVASDEQLEGYVQTRVAGWIKEVFVNQTYQHVTRGEPLFSMYSPIIVSAEHEYLLALDTTKKLRHSDVTGVASGAEALTQAALNRLKLFGVSPREVARLERQRTVRRAVEIDSPMTGYVVSRMALPNQYVQPDTRLYSISNLSTVWVYAAVFQNQIGEIKVGDPVSVSVDAYPGRKFDGHVDFIWPAVDPNTRTVKVRCAFSNRQHLLKLGMYVRAVLKPQLARGLAIPVSGVFRTGTHNIVFVDRGDGRLDPVEVELGPQVGDYFEVRSGLRAGERIVSSANFLIDSESQLEAALGTFTPPPAGASAQANVPSGRIELTTKPDPPRKGINRVLITVRDSSGQLVTDAHVSLAFSMPAMPAMGMAAMRETAIARPVAHGTYSAEVNLSSGGTWSVTAVASRAGQEIASLQLNLSVPDGM